MSHYVASCISDAAFKVIISKRHGSQCTVFKICYAAVVREIISAHSLLSLILYVNKGETRCGAKAQQTPSPCCASRHRAVSRKWPKM